MGNNRNHTKIITAISIILPIAVAVLFQVKIEGYDFSFLPGIYAGINAVTAVLLVVALILIKAGRREAHRRIMIVNLILSALFLVMYIVYHITSDPATYGGESPVLYKFILISHIGLSGIVAPLVLFTLSRALSGEFDRHKRLARFTFPVWLYVAVTGVIVYWMISPYYVKP